MRDTVFVAKRLSPLSSQVLCGAIRGALEMVQLEMQVWFIRDTSRGDSSSEIRVKFIRRMDEIRPPGDD